MTVSPVSKQNGHGPPHGGIAKDPENFSKYLWTIGWPKGPCSLRNVVGCLSMTWICLRHLEKKGSSPHDGFMMVYSIINKLRIPQVKSLHMAKWLIFCLFFRSSHLEPPQLPLPKNDHYGGTWALWLSWLSCCRKFLGPKKMWKTVDMSTFSIQLVKIEWELGRLFGHGEHLALPKWKKPTKWPCGTSEPTSNPQKNSGFSPEIPRKQQKMTFFLARRK